MYAKSIRPSVSAMSKKNGARRATIKSRALGALKLAGEASCARSGQIFSCWSGFKSEITAMDSQLFFVQ